MLFNINEMTSKSVIKLDSTCTIDGVLKVHDILIRQYIDTLPTSEKFIFMYFMKACTAYEECEKINKFVLTNKKIHCNTKINDFYLGRTSYKENLNNVYNSFTDAKEFLNTIKSESPFTQIINNSSEKFYNTMKTIYNYMEVNYNGTC